MAQVPLEQLFSARRRAWLLATVLATTALFTYSSFNRLKELTDASEERAGQQSFLALAERNVLDHLPQRAGGTCGPAGRRRGRWAAAAAALRCFCAACIDSRNSSNEPQTCAVCRPQKRPPRCSRRSAAGGAWRGDGKSWRSSRTCQQQWRQWRGSRRGSGGSGRGREHSRTAAATAARPRRRQRCQGGDWKREAVE